MTAGRIDALGVFGGLLYVIRQHQGRSGEIADLFLDAARDNPSIASLRADEARELLAVEALNGFDIALDSEWLIGMHSFLDAAASADDRAAAQTLVELVAPYAGQVVVSLGGLVLSAISRPLARVATVLGDYGQAEEWFAIAHDIHNRLEAPFWTARAQLDHADLCLARRADGDIERARDLITTAASTAAEYGCAGLTKRANRLLANL